MSTRDSIITQSMLASYLTAGTMDYVELVSPFMLKCLPTRISEEISLTSLQDSMNSLYDLDIPKNMIEKMLIRQCKKKNGAYVRRDKKKYYVDKVYDSKDFDDRTRIIKGSIDDVIKKMEKFFSEQKYISGISDEKAKEFLEIFLDTYNYTVYENAEALSLVTKETNAESNYYVAQFVLHEYKGQTKEFNSVLEIIKGALTAKSIYYFMNSENAIEQKRINGTTFVLDTRILIEALGLNLEEEHKATSELLSMIVNNGGKLATYDYYVTELHGIIHKYCVDSTAKLTLSLDYFRRTRKTVAEVKAYGDTLEGRLEELQIEILEKESCEDDIKNQDWCIDYSELRNALSTNIEYSNRNGEYFSEALINDTETIQAIAYKRRKPKKCTIFNCDYIFVTKNKDICKVVYDLYRDRFKGEINYVITDIDLTAMIWLSTFGSKRNLPQLKLIENAYSACAPSREVMSTFLDTVNTCEDEGKISQDMAILLRSQHATVEDIADITHNSQSAVSEKTVIEAQKRLHNRMKKDIKTELSGERKLLDDKAENLRQEGEAIENERQDIISERKQVEKDKDDLRFIARRISLEKQRNDDGLKKLKNARDNVVAEAVENATTHKNIIKHVLTVIAIAVLFALWGLFVYATLKIAVATNQSNISLAVYIGVVTIVDMAFSFVSYKKFLTKLIYKVAEWSYDRTYSSVIRKYTAIMSNASDVA